MNKFTVIAALVFASSFTQAKVMCGVSSESVNGSGVFDKALWSGELKKTEIIVISKDRQSAKALDFSGMSNPKVFQEMDKQRIAAFSYQPKPQAGEDKIFLGTGHLDMKAASKNLTPIDVSTYGAPTEKSPLFLMSKGLALVCY